MVETKEVYFNDRPPETRFYWHASLCITTWSNIRIFEDKSRIRLDKPMDTYGLRNPRFIIEYSNIRIRPSQNALHWASPLFFNGCPRQWSRDDSSNPWIHLQNSSILWLQTVSDDDDSLKYLKLDFF